jgi:hypothetical protein
LFSTWMNATPRHCTIKLDLQNRFKSCNPGAPSLMIYH